MKRRNTRNGAARETSQQARQTRRVSLPCHLRVACSTRVPPTGASSCEHWDRGLRNSSRSAHALPSRIGTACHPWPPRYPLEEEAFLPRPPQGYQ